MAENKLDSIMDLVPVSGGADSLTAAGEGLPAIVSSAGPAARFAYDEFFYGKIRNPHTRAAYRRAVNQFLAWCDDCGLDLAHITPKHVGQYLDYSSRSVSTMKQHLAAVRHFFDELVTRHVVVLNPAASVRGQRHQVLEGKTPEITVRQARKLLGSIDMSNVVGLRDRAAIAVMIYTAARVGAVAKLQRGHFYFAGEQWCLHFDDKGGKSREIPVRHDLQQFLFNYIDAAGIRDADKASPIFRTAVRKEKRLTSRRMTTGDLCRMIKRRMRDAGLPSQLSAHSFRVATITDLLEQGVPLEDVQHLAGHADPRTTRLYDRRKKKITRNIVERISI